MAKVLVAGSAVVVTSEVKLEDIKMVSKYRPAALALMGGEDGKEEIFRVGIGSGSINEYGVSFNEETRDENKLAVLTMFIDYKGDDIKGYLADEIGGALNNLAKIEVTIPGTLAEIKAEREAVMAGISVA